MLAMVLLLGLLSVATATDLLRHKIYNWTTYPGILAALCLNAAGWGRVNFWEGVAGFLACGFVMLVCYVMPQIGGGDVKLIAMMGTFLGPEDGIEAMLWTFVLGGCMGLIVLIWRVGPWRLLVRAIRQVLWTLRLRSWARLSEEERAELQTRLFLAPSAVAAAIIVRFSLHDVLFRLAGLS